MFNANDLVFSQEGGSVTAGGYTINSALMESKCPALISYVNKDNRNVLVPAGFILMKEATANIIKHKTGGGIVPDNMFQNFIDKVNITSPCNNISNKTKRKFKTKKQNKTRKKK